MANNHTFYQREREEIIENKKHQPAQSQNNYYYKEPSDGHWIFICGIAIGVILAIAFMKFI